MSDETRSGFRKWLSTGRLTAIGFVLLFAAVVVSYALPIYWEHCIILTAKRLGSSHYEIVNRKPLWIWGNAPDDWQVLRELNLEGGGVDDWSLGVISGFRELEILDVSGTTISDEGLATLDNLTQLEELYLCETSISDAGLKHLARMTNLKGLNLTGTQVTKGGLMEIRRQLPGCKVFW